MLTSSACSNFSNAPFRWASPIKQNGHTKSDQIVIFIFHPPYFGQSVRSFLFGHHRQIQWTPQNQLAEIHQGPVVYVLMQPVLLLTFRFSFLYPFHNPPLKVCLSLMVKEKADIF